MPALNPFNQYSFLFFTGVVLLGLGGVLAWTGWTRQKALAWGAAVLALTAAWFGLRTGTSPYTDASQAEVVIQTARRPVLVEFYSDYCIACMAARPTLDTLEKDLKNQLQVVRLDVASGAGQALGGKVGVRGTPTFILFDAAGQEIWRSLGGLDDQQVRSALGST